MSTMPPNNPFTQTRAAVAPPAAPKLVTVTLLVTVEQMGPVSCTNDEVGSAVARAMRKTRIVWAGAGNGQTGYLVTNVAAHDVAPLAAGGPR